MWVLLALLVPAAVRAFGNLGGYGDDDGVDIFAFPEDDLWPFWRLSPYGRLRSQF